jgi:hypothetical protein
VATYAWSDFDSSDMRLQLSNGRWRADAGIALATLFHSSFSRPASLNRTAIGEFDHCGDGPYLGRHDSLARALAADRRPRGPRCGDDLERRHISSRHAGRDASRRRGSHFDAMTPSAVIADQRLAAIRLAGDLNDNLVTLESLAATQPGSAGRYRWRGCTTCARKRYEATANLRQWMVAPTPERPLAVQLDGSFRRRRFAE